jgi:phosphatidylinositol phosphate synthase
MSADVAGALLVAVLLASMPWFAVLRRGRAIDPDVARRPASALLGVWVRDWAVWLLGPIERALVHGGVSPTLLNFAGALAGLAAGGAFASGHLALAACLLVLAGICDIFDGRVARARGVVSRSGAFLDSTLDRFGETAAFTGIAWGLSGSRWMAAATALALGSSMLVSYAKARGEALGAPFGGGLLQRAERMVLLILGGLLDPVAVARLGWPPGGVLAGVVAVIAVGTLGTAVYRTATIARMLARADAAEANE